MQDDLNIFFNILVLGKKIEYVNFKSNFRLQKEQLYGVGVRRAGREVVSYLYMVGKVQVDFIGSSYSLLEQVRGVRRFLLRVRELGQWFGYGFGLQLFSFYQRKEEFFNFRQWGVCGSRFQSREKFQEFQLVFFIRFFYRIV